MMVKCNLLIQSYTLSVPQGGVLYNCCNKKMTEVRVKISTQLNSNKIISVEQVPDFV